MNELEIIEYIKKEYNINVVQVVPLLGGWKNEKYIVMTSNGNKYVFKVYSVEKVEKMSQKEYSQNYIANQIKCNLSIESFFYKSGLNCPDIIIQKDGEFLSFSCGIFASLMSFVDGKHIDRNEIIQEQLFNLGQECAKMHELFHNIDYEIYNNGRYLKIPTIDELFSNLENKFLSSSKNSPPLYIKLLEKQQEILKTINSNGLISEIPICITHGDFTDDNILFCGNNPYILDFELIRKNSHLLDIGRILLSYCYDINQGIDFNKLNSFCEGYRTIKNITQKDIMLSLIVVWINEVDMWIKENYFNKIISSKAKRFQDELIFLTNNFWEILNLYYQKESFSSSNKIFKRR